MSDAPRLLTAAEILAADDITYEIVHVPEWGGSVRVRSLNSEARDLWESSLTKRVKDRDAQGRMIEKSVPDLHNMRARLVALSACDDNGAPLFEMKQVQALGRKNSAPVDRIADVAQRLSGITRPQVEALEDELREDPTSDSPSVSPESSE